MIWSSCRSGPLRRPLAVLVLAGLATGEPTLATGFYINQQSVRSLGRVDAGNTVAADDLGTIFFNPAGLPGVWPEAPVAKIKVELGVHLIVPRSDQRNQGSDAASPGTRGAFLPILGGDAHNSTDPTPVPSFYVAVPVRNGRGAIGLGVNAPFGLATTFDADWSGRYDATEASLRTVNVSVVGAYRITRAVSVGGGLDVQYAKTLLTSAIPNPLIPGGPTAATDARVRTEGHAYTPGFNVGLMLDLDAATRVGVHYRSAMTHDVDGSSELTGLPAPLAAFNAVVDARTELDLPSITSAGVRRAIGDRSTLYGEFAWFDWSRFKEIRIEYADGRPDGVRPVNYRDAYAVAVGAEQTLSDRWTGRAGLHYDTTPTVDAYRDSTVPDAPRVWLGLGASYRMSAHTRIDIAFTHAFFRDTDVSVSRTFFDDTPLATTGRIKSRVTSAVNTIAVGFGYGF
jgi:long-chain fatty acid transport protein